MRVCGQQRAAADLRPPDNPEVSRTRAAALPVQITVVTPTAVRALDTDRILVRPQTERISYYPGAAWSDRLPRLVRARLAEALENSGHFRAVVTEDDGVSSPYSLQVSLRAFEMSVNGKPPEGHVAMSARIVDARAGKVVASQSFKARARAASDGVGAGVAAITQAFHEASRELISWMTQWQPPFAAGRWVIAPTSYWHETTGDRHEHWRGSA